MRQYLKNEVFKISKWIEFYLSALIAIAVIGGGIWMIKDLIAILSSIRIPMLSISLYSMHLIL